MISIRVITDEGVRIIDTDSSRSLLDILGTNGFTIYAPCGGKGTCGKCRVNIPGEGNVISCTYYPDKDIEVILPGKSEATILVRQTEFLEDLPFENKSKNISINPYGVAVDLGTSTVVMYFLDLLTGQIKKIASFINPQSIYGADVISRINYCQEHNNGLVTLQQAIIRAINDELDAFMKNNHSDTRDFEKIVVAGNTTMLHILLGADPLSIAMAPFTPIFTGKQTLKGKDTGLNIDKNAELVTIPCISAYIGADIVAGMAAINTVHKNYIFLDIGTNGELVLVRNNEIYACSAAAGPAFEGAGLSCGMSAVDGAISGFTDKNNYRVIGNTDPRGICGSGIVDIVAYLLTNDIIDETGLLRETFIIHDENKIQVTRHDIREIQLAKSAIYSGINILIKKAGLSYHDIDILFLAGGFGNYINIKSAIQIGLLPHQLKNKIYPVGNSAGIGALQYLKSKKTEQKIHQILKRVQYIELSGDDEFTMQFALNMNFT